MTPTQPRRRAFTSLVLAGSLLLGGLAVMLASASPAAAASCGSGMSTNVVTAQGSSYGALTSPTATFSISSTRISWSLKKGATFVTGTAAYAKGSTTLGPSSNNVSITTTKGRLTTLIVCTTTPSVSSSSTTTTTVPSSKCTATEVKNTLAWDGVDYSDSNASTLEIYRSTSSTLSWRLLSGVRQTRATAIYEGAVIKSVSGQSVAKTAPKSGYNMRLLVVTICTTAP